MVIRLAVFFIEITIWLIEYSKVNCIVFKFREYEYVLWNTYYEFKTMLHSSNVIMCTNILLWSIHTKDVEYWIWIKKYIYVYV